MYLLLQPVAILCFSVIVLLVSGLTPHWQPSCVPTGGGGGKVGDLPSPSKIKNKFPLYGGPFSYFLSPYLWPFSICGCLFCCFLSLWGALFSMRWEFLLLFLYAGIFLHVEGAFCYFYLFFLCRGPFLHLWGTFFELAPPYKKFCWRHVPVIVFVLMSNLYTKLLSMSTTPCTKHLYSLDIMLIFLSCYVWWYITYNLLTYFSDYILLDIVYFVA